MTPAEELCQIIEELCKDRGATFKYNGLHVMYDPQYIFRTNENPDMWKVSIPGLRVKGSKPFKTLFEATEYIDKFIEFETIEQPSIELTTFLESFNTN